jgi:hypothetical protein
MQNNSLIGFLCMVSVVVQSWECATTMDLMGLSTKDGTHPCVVSYVYVSGCARLCPHNISTTLTPHIRRTKVAQWPQTGVVFHESAGYYCASRTVISCSLEQLREYRRREFSTTLLTLLTKVLNLLPTSPIQKL